MASRVLFRRLLRPSSRLQGRVKRQIVAPSLISNTRLSQPLTACPQSYSQIRGLCDKGGQRGLGMVIHIQDTQDFEDRVINSKTPVVVDFHASWCGPCKLLGPRLESLVGEREGKVILAKIDVDDHEDLVHKYRIASVPTVMGFKNTEKVDSFIGLKDDDVIETFLDKLIG